MGRFWENDPEQWWRAMDVNLRGPLLCSYPVLPGMIARRRGRIINVSSGAGTRAMSHLSAYVASKTALLRFTESLALEAKAHGVSVFALGPGTVRTAMAVLQWDLLDSGNRLILCGV
jgi:NAD(P)-dependent dehydrogenase (short-subunit alcohol dehydrogenase family)